MGKRGPEYTLEQIERIATKLDALPKIEKARFGKRDAIERLSKSILNVLKRGYSMDDIADSLREEGLNLTASTLKTYLHRATAKSTKAKPDPPPIQPSRPSPRDARSPAKTPLPASRGTFVPREDSDEI
ncbi:MAG: protein mobC [Candidatus Contendobacter sp.]